MFNLSSWVQKKKTVPNGSKIIISLPPLTLENWEWGFSSLLTSPPNPIRSATLSPQSFRSRWRATWASAGWMLGRWKHDAHEPGLPPGSQGGDKICDMTHSMGISLNYSLCTNRNRKTWAPNVCCAFLRGRLTNKTCNENTVNRSEQRL